MAGRALTRRTVSLLLLVTAALTLVPAIQTVAQALTPTASVRDHGAKGDGSTNDTVAIQRANNAVAAQGGGVVHFPPGTYVAQNLRQDSNVEFRGTPGATLKHPNGISGYNIVEGRVNKKRGWVVEGSPFVTMSDTKGVLPGAIVGIRGAGGASSVQTSTLSAAIMAGSMSLTVADASGWGVATSYILIDNEILSYNNPSGSSLRNLGRARLGTKAAAHAKGARVSLLQVLYARVVSVGGDWIQLDRVAVQGVKGADVYAGSINMTVRGLAFDGNRKSYGAVKNPFPLLYDLARWVHIDGNTIYNGDHGAISMDKGTSDSLVENNVLADNGDTAKTLGSAVWLFRGASDNTVRGNTILGDSNHGVIVDDRSERSTEWDGTSDRNFILANRIDIPAVPGNSAIYVIGSNRNVVESNDIRSTVYGIAVTRSTQGTRPGAASANVVRTNQLTGVQTGLFVTGSDNWFERNTLTLISEPIVDLGIGNRFIENLLVAS